MPWGRKLERALHWIFAALAVVWVLLGLLGAWIAASHPAQAAELRGGELEIFARVVQAETTGEPAAGQRAVAWTVINRLRAGSFGNTATRVILAPYQYAKPAALNDAGEDYQRALLATLQALLGTVPDDSRGATHFVRCDLRPQPRWAREYELRAKISAHCFYRERR
jgi:N-acetylmuramoyl-L-alanine amidase